jgi:K+-transporting ATPase ATPase C chain
MRTLLRHQVAPAVGLLAVMTLLTGVAYPAAVTAVAQAVLPAQANGSLIVVDGRSVGSSLIGQAFSDPRYFWGRPSAAGPNRQLIDRVTAEVDRLRAANGDGPVPVDLVTTSASGLDPDISPAAAEYQVARVAAARGIPVAEVRAAVARHTEAPLLGFLGQPRVNVLALNLDLDGALR